MAEAAYSAFIAQALAPLRQPPQARLPAAAGALIPHAGHVTLRR
jgi:hypothetical protein